VLRGGYLPVGDDAVVHLNSNDYTAQWLLKRVGTGGISNLNPLPDHNIYILVGRYCTVCTLIPTLCVHTHTNRTMLSTLGPPPNNPPKPKRVNCKCSHQNCDNRAVQGGVCITHGTQRKCCAHPGCDKAVRISGYCLAHGPSRRKCDHEIGCSRVGI